MCTECQNKTINRVPDSWYELSSRISSAQAVASYIIEAIPFGTDPDTDQRKAAECASGLANAVIDLLDMCEKDCERLELEIKNADPQT
ncbi:MAG: hypothetical protein JNL77_08865 [Nitrosomonas sp.]|nr:hypothetical protein [Nitrosomonas sp.]